MDCNYRTSVYILSLDQCFWDSSLPQAGTPRVFWSINVHHWHLLQHLWFFCCSKEEPRHSLLQYSVSALPTNRAKASSRITARSVCRCLVSSWVYVYVESQLDLLFVYWCFCANNLCLCLQSSIFCSVSRVYVKFFWFLVSVYSDSGSVHGCFPALFGNRDVFPAELSFPWGCCSHFICEDTSPLSFSFMYFWISLLISFLRLASLSRLGLSLHVVSL